MPLKKLKKALQSLNSLFTSIKKAGAQPDWNPVLKKLENISDIAKSANWQSIQDTCEIGKNLILKFFSGEALREPKANRHFKSILKILDDLHHDIQSKGDITISIKGSLAKIKMFIGDFTYSHEDPKDTQLSKESGLSSIDVTEELNKRVENLESLIIGVKESYFEPEVVNAIFREFHTLKGEAGFLGFESLGKFCHRMETTLDPLRNKRVFVTQEIIDILLFSVDKTKEHIKNVHKKKETDNSDDTDEKLSQLEKFIKEIKDKPADKEANQDVQSDVVEAKIEKKEADSTTASDFAEAFPLDEDEELENEQLEEKEVIDSELPQRTQEDITDSKQSDEKKEESTAPEIKTREEDLPVYLNVETDKVDSLINITGELTILYQMIQQSSEIRQISDQKITNNIDMMGRFFKELQNIVISIRTVSIRSLFLKMARLARELGKIHEKNVKVTVIGETTQVDKNLINLLTGPLTHVIRNSIGHGIEPPHERLEANKAEVGNIILEAKKKGNSTMVQVRDDGKGVSFGRLETRAKELGLVEPHVVLSDEERYELMFRPGLSTSSKVTSTSGRGVGMDIIRSEVVKAKGTMEVISEEGKGTTVILLFPQTFAITEGLIVRVNKNFFIVPIGQVREMALYDPTKVKTVKNKSKMILIRNCYVPLIELESFLRVKPPPSISHFQKGDISNSPPLKMGENRTEQQPVNGAMQIIVTVESENKRCVLLVDEVVLSQEVVVKELTGSFSDLPYFSGTAILGNKGVGVMLDIAKITEKNHSLGVREELSASAQNYGDDRINVVEIGTNKVAMIDFFIETDKERSNFAINAFKIREFVPIDMYRPIPLPRAPYGFEGVITLRGDTLPLFSLSKLLDLDTGGRPKDKIIIICEFSNKTVGFLVTGVVKVNYISWDEILPPPKTGGRISLKNVVGIILKKTSKDQIKSNKNTQGITFVLDFEKILNDVIPLYDSMDNNKIKLKKARKLNNVVLLVEDSLIMRSKMKKGLESGGITVIEAENGQEALDIVNKYFQQSKENDGSIFDYLDLVISDIEMPLLDGYTLTKTIKAHPELRVLPVLLHSSLSNETIVQRAKEVHADGFVSKCDSESLLKTLQKYL